MSFLASFHDADINPSVVALSLLHQVGLSQKLTLVRLLFLFDRRVHAFKLLNLFQAVVRLDRHLVCVDLLEP